MRMIICECKCVYMSVRLYTYKLYAPVDINQHRIAYSVIRNESLFKKKDLLIRNVNHIILN